MHTATFFNGCQYHQSLFFSKVCSTVVSKEHRITVYCKGLSEPKGFGSGDGKGKGSKHAKGLTKKAFGEGSPQFKKLLKEVEKGKLNIDPNVAAKGKVDFVRVESWGSGVDPDKQLENLKMKSFSPSFTSLDENAPLYEQLVRRLQLFEAKASIYTALEDAVSSVKQSRCSGQDEHVPFVGAAIAVSIFDKDLGLNRSKYVRRLGTIASSDENAEEACLRLFSHIFALHVAHLTTGMRIGVKAVASLPSMVGGKAVNFYRDYPQQASDPLKVFIEAVNRAGKFLTSEDDREKIMLELPKAIQKTSLLLAVLAVE